MIAHTWKHTLMATLLLGLTGVSSNSLAAVVLTATDWNGFTNVTTTKNVGASNTFSASGTTEMQIYSYLAGGSAETQRLVWDSTFSYDPGVSGAVDSIDFSIDQRRVGGTPGAHGWGVGFMQDSNVFLFSGYHAFGAGTYSWNTWDATDITSSTYWLQATATGLVAPTSTLDLSASGNAINVGVFIFSGNGGSPTRNDTTAYDNLSVSFNTVDNAVPAPGALALLLTGLAGFGWTRRQVPHVTSSS